MQNRSDQGLHTALDAVSIQVERHTHCFFFAIVLILHLLPLNTQLMTQLCASSADKCGVCGGDNSTCRVIKGTFDSTNHRIRYGYNRVVRVPEGATNLDVRQQSHDHTSKDDNYLGEMHPGDGDVGVRDGVCFLSRSSDCRNVFFLVAGLAYEHFL